MNKLKKIGNIFAEYAKKLYTAITDNKKAFALLLYMVLIHFSECLMFFIGQVNGTLFNPFLQGLWSWLAIFGIALLCGQIAFKCILTIIIAIQAKHH